MKLVPRDYQIHAYNNLGRSIVAGNKRVVLKAPTGTGKCLGKGTPVLMHNGSIKRVEDVSPGDLVMGPDSEFRQVISTCQGTEEMFRITPTKGDAFECNRSHIISLKKTGSEEIVNISVDEYLNKNKTFKHTHKLWRYAVEYPEKLLPVDPYILGLWLGDGWSYGTAITSADSEVIDAWCEYALKNGLRIHKDSQPNRVVNYHIAGDKNKNFVRESLKSLNLLKNKHIPSIYLTSSRVQRLSLLAGIIDTDGFLNNCCYDLVVKQHKFANDIAYLCRSLGLSCYPKKCIKTCTNTGASGTYYRMSICGDISIIPCKVERRKAPVRGQKKDVLKTGFKIESIGVGEYYGFELAGNDRLFLLGDFTVTHNTETAVLMIQGALNKGKRVAFVAPYTVLINQTVERLAKYEITSVGVMQGNHELTDPSQPVQICTAQTLGRREKPNVDLVIVDECDLQYQVVYDWMAECPDVIFIGLTATPFGKGMGKYYQDLIRVKDLRECLEDGTLCEYEVYGVDDPDTSGVPMGADGDYREKELAQIMGDAALVANVVDNWLKNGRDGQTIVFAVNVLHANDLTNKFESAGIAAEVITAKTPLHEREAMFKRYQDRITRVLISVGVLIAGFDSYVDIIIFATKTKSRRKLIQACGRGLRQAKDQGKEICTIFDHGGSISLLGYLEDIDDAFTGLDMGDKKGSSYDIAREKPEKLPKKCPSCDFLKPAGVHECPKCGFKPRAGQDVEVNEDFELKKLKGKQKNATREEKELFFRELCGWALRRNTNGKPTSKGRVSNIYREKFGVWPKDLDSRPLEPGADVLNFIKSRNIAYAKSKNK